MKFTWANIVTLLRLFLAPVFLVVVLTGEGTNVAAALAVFALAALTDWLDGYLARRYGEVTSHGAFLDPLADKVLTTSAFVALYMYDVVPLWMLVILIARDFSTTALRSIVGDRGSVVNTSMMAKVKTFLQMVFIIVALLLLSMTRLMNGTSAGVQAQIVLDSWFMDVIMFVITAMALWTLFKYLQTHSELFRRGRS
ncbi:MAG: CDP-diacylglycerol--glycerol-3-phosphate 3-phosphatidyltransferase [Bacteroidota bacterium]|jgi:CDP-diacylglycerol--glycerol-3-phosphate 3-phosphatidyltransferase